MVKARLPFTSVCGMIVSSIKDTEKKRMSKESPSVALRHPWSGVAVPQHLQEYLVGLDTHPVTWDLDRRWCHCSRPALEGPAPPLALGDPEK